MSIKSIVRNVLSHPLARGIDLDSEEATEIHTALIRKKAFLKRQYDWYYRQFVAADRAAPTGPRLEIGSGGGFLSELIEGLVTVDLRRGADVDLAASATELPLRPDSVGAIYMLNVLHHLPDVRRFFDEADRVLRPGGRLTVIEPYVSPLSRQIYRNLHHEPFDPERSDWSFEWTGSMTSANLALPWMVFVRDRDVFEREYPNLAIEKIRPHTVLTYLLSGGVSMRSMLPGIAFDPLNRLELSMGSALTLLASMMTVEIVKRG